MSGRVRWAGYELRLAALVRALPGIVSARPWNQGPAGQSRPDGPAIPKGLRHIMPPQVEGRTVAAENRRKNLRLQILGQLYGQVVPLDVSFAVRNLSAGGFAVESPIRFHTGTAHEFRFTLADGRTVKVGGETVHCMRVRTPEDGVRFLAGFRFVADAEDAEAAEAIQTLLDWALANVSYE
jgi:hypothetical protein